MLALGTILLSSAWQAATAVGHVLPDLSQRDFDASLLSSNDTGNYTAPGRGNYTWTPTCRLPSPSDLLYSMGFDPSNNCVASTGTLRAFMLFVDFPDAMAPEGESPQSMHDAMVPTAAEWYAQASYGTLNLNVTADTSAYYRMPKAAAAYDWLGSTFRQDAYARDALNAFTANGARLPPDVDVLYVVPTSRAAPWMSRSQTLFDPVSTREGQTVKKTVTFGASDGDLNTMTMVHETGHTFCLPDYYSFSSYAGLYVGSFSVMAQTVATAPDYFAWDKYRLGWIRDEAVDCVLDAGSTEHVLTPLAVAGPGKKAVVVAASETQALIAEVRIAAGVDQEACAPGVLLTTVDTRTPGGNGPIRVVDATPGSMGCAGQLDDLNDAALSLSLEGSKSLAYAPVSSFDVPGWGVKVTLVSVAGQKYTIRIDRETSARTNSY
ncbi:M6 metalloprotease [Apiospora rasikravindrae]|uniref:M6 metalloprotease n=1 Tax=Apiospora rasikravindrae TaxID=990691 RepID=A0ABR1RXU3_9PEZI